MTTLLWPEKTLPPRAVVARADPRTVSGGLSSTGQETVVATDAGSWRIVLQGLKPRTAQQQELWDFLSVSLGGRAVPIAVPLYKHMTAPWPLLPDGRRVPAARNVPFSNGALFSNGAGFHHDSIKMTLRAALLRATTVVMDLQYGQAPRPGQVFGIGDQRAHIIKSVVANGAAYTCTITPPLRAAVEADTRVEWDNPRVLCRLTADDAMATAFDLARFGEADVSFMEHF